MPWPYQKYGTTPDPVHKSHLNELTGEYGCPRRFRYQRDAEHAEAHGGAARELKATLNCHLACGTAAHETVARALSNPRVRDHLLLVPGAALPELDARDKLESRVRATFSHELRAAADGREIDWGTEDAESMISERVDMIVGTLGTLCRYASKVLAVEPGFIVELEGVVYSGHIDLVFEPRENFAGVGIADWKTGKSKPDPLELAHGWEAGIYSAACELGVFLPREAVKLDKHPDGTWSGTVYFTTPGLHDDGVPRAVPVTVTRPSKWQAERDGLETALQYLWTHEPSGVTHADAFRLNQYPTHVYHVHMRDFVPYQKAGDKQAKRPEDLEYYRLDRPGKVKYVAGDLRGPGWLPVALHANDVARLAYRARNVVGTVRMGRFFDLVREHCNRCPYKQDCLTGGYAPRGDELTALQDTLKKAGLT